MVQCYMTSRFYWIRELHEPPLRGETGEASVAGYGGCRGGTRHWYMQFSVLRANIHVYVGGSVLRKCHKIVMGSLLGPLGHRDCVLCTAGTQMACEEEFLALPTLYNRTHPEGRMHDAIPSSHPTWQGLVASSTDKHPRDGRTRPSSPPAYIRLPSG